MAIGDERVTIRINVRADTKEIDRVRAKLAALCAQAESCDDTFENLGKNIDEAGRANRNFGKDSDTTRNKLKSVGREANLLAKIMKTAYKFAFIGAGIETAALALALSSVNGLLATGRFLVKSYHVVMSGMAKAAAAAGVALATVAAAQRQFIAAQASGRYGGSYGAASQGLRILSGDAKLAVLGMKGLTGAFQAASKNARVTGATASALAGLMDFAVLSGDMEKGAAALANIISLVQKGGARGKGVAEAAKEIGPEFEKAFQTVSRGGKATSAELMKAFSSGVLSREAGISGTYANVQGTLMGQFKAFMTEAQVMFGDLGQNFIGPVQNAFSKVTETLKRTILQIGPLLNNFAKGGLLDKAVDGIDKIAQFLVTLMRDYVPRTQNFFGSLSKMWNKLTNGFERFGKYLNQFKDASRIINKFFGQILGALGRGLKNNFENFAALLVENKDQFEKFGDSLAGLIDKIFEFFKAIRTAFMDALPYINRVIDAIGGLISAFTQFFSVMGAGLGGFGSFLALLAPFFLGGKGGKGALGKMSMGGKFGVGALGLLGLVGATGGANSGGIKGFLGDVGDTAMQVAMARALLPQKARGPATRAIVGTAATEGAIDFMYTPPIGPQKNRAVTATTGALGYAATAAATTAAFAAPLNAVPMFGQALYIGSIVLAAIGGGIFGAIKGWSHDSKYKKQSKEAAEAWVNEYSSDVENAFASNDLEVATTAIKGFEDAARKMSKSLPKSGTGFKHAMEIFGEKNYEDTLTVMTNRFEDLGIVSGLTSKQIQALANSAEINLGDSMLTLQQILEATGIATQRVGEDFQNYLIDTFAQDVMGIEQDVARLNAPMVVNEIAQGFADEVKGGVAGATEFGAFLSGVQEQQQLRLGTAGADKALIQMLGLPGALGTGAAFMPGGVFGAQGITPDMMTPEMKQVYDAYLGRRTESYAGVTAENIVSGLAGKGGMLAGMNVDQLRTMLAGVPLDKLIALSEKVGRGGAFTSQGGVAAYGTQGGGESLETQLTQLFGEFGIKLGENIQIEKTNDQKMLEGIDAFVRGTGTFKSDAIIFKEAVDKFALSVGFAAADTSTPRRNIVDTFGAHSRVNVGFAGADTSTPRRNIVDTFGAHSRVNVGFAAADTSTPRRNIVDTFGAHNRVNSMIAGRRSVTSGYRTSNLGSINSDHAAGRAYDLVGQNLGLYQMAIRAGGGYAEFHGGSAQRHLHVVPNVSGHMGDDATPVVSSGPSMPSSSTTMTNNITIYQQPGQDSTALAQEVIAQIERMQRSRGERY